MRLLYYGFLMVLLTGCNAFQSALYPLDENEFVIAFGSCNRQDDENHLWDDVLANNPSVWIWGGDNIYSDTDDVREMRKDYEVQRYQYGYMEVRYSMDVIGSLDVYYSGIVVCGRV